MRLKSLNSVIPKNDLDTQEKLMQGLSCPLDQHTTQRLAWR